MLQVVAVVQIVMHLEVQVAELVVVIRILLQLVMLDVLLAEK